MLMAKSKMYIPAALELTNEKMNCLATLKKSFIMPVFFGDNAAETNVMSKRLPEY